MTESVRLTHEEAADEEALKAAVEVSKAEGRPLVISDADETPPPEVLDLTDRGLLISSEDARDPVKYRRARAQAAAEGKTLHIGPRIPPKRTVEPGTVIIPKGATSQEYRRLKAAAESRGVPFLIGEV